MLRISDAPIRVRKKKGCVSALVSYVATLSGFGGPVMGEKESTFSFRLVLHPQVLYLPPGRRFHNYTVQRADM